MIDLDKYEDAITFKQELELGGISVCRDDVLELITRLRQAEKDAARWRFLTDSPSGSLTLRIHNSRCDHRDGAIDEAMNASNN
ncbi:MAG: hypothetical protein ACRCXB_10355 [Aeromonadaceae bacterium]